MNKKAVIVSGGSIDQSFGLQLLNEIKPEYIIGVDSGLKFLYTNRIMPTHIVGDFDSVDPAIIAYYKDETNIPVRQFNPVKDASDTEIGLRYALELGAEELFLLGATGTRLDHVMANIQILKIAHDAGVKAYIVDNHNKISLKEKEINLKKQNSFGYYFSIFPFGGIVQDVTITGAKYPLEHYCLCPHDSRCVSNEIVEDVKIEFPEGIIILMETRD